MRLSKFSPAPELVTIDPSTIGRQWGPIAQDPPGQVDLVRGIGVAPGGRSPAAGGGGPGFLDYALGLLIDGQAPGQVKAQHQARQNAAADDAARRELAGKLGDRERLAYLTTPDQWGARVASNMGPQEVQGGNTLLRPGFGVTVAPKMTEDGGVYGTQTAGGWTQTGARDMGASEAVNARIAAEKLALEGEKLEALEGYRAGQLDIGRGRLAVAKAKSGGKPGSSSSGVGSLPPGYRPRSQ